ncbi:hypothetical protein [Streptomyces caatingaensis]|uniref:hypothetical protein n=1 Tax=Streptomyces caatingaensis TaxID=1678637 RepID=UPI000672812E|nr:hypothetical protein [Streptomyces caatingaensis]
MGFFDEPLVVGQQAGGAVEFVDLPPRTAGHADDGPPEDRCLPTVLPRVARVGAGPHVRLMFTGWTVWPGMAEFRLDVFWRRKRADGAFPAAGFGPPGPEALRVGLLLADGRRVTTLDPEPWPPPPPGRRPLALRESGSGGGGFHCTLVLALSELPPEGPTVLVVEWPEEGVPETRTVLDTGGLAEAALGATEVWPELSGPAGAAPPASAVPAPPGWDGAGRDADLPGAVRPARGERAAQAAADRLTAVFSGVDAAGLGVAFVAGIDEDEAIRRLGAGPQGADGPDPDDAGASTPFVGVTGVPGGCVVAQPLGRLPAEAAVLERLSAGTVAYGVHFDAAGGVFGTLARDGRAEDEEEIGLDASSDDPVESWLYRFWQRDDASRDARCPAHACARAGMRLTDSAPVTGPPRHWVPVRLGGNRRDGRPAGSVAWAW